MANNDRVNELYRGEIFGAEAQRICRDRIHWMVSSCRGQRVLDIGCSQGIATLLAAREGCEVIGVDVEEPAIDVARRELALESDEVRSRTQFVLGSIYDLDLDGRRFDTVLLGEVLEHQANPRRLFERAQQFLADDGLLVVTTPFGLHVHHDHRTTFYLRTFAETVADLCQPRSLEVVDGIIRFTAFHRNAEPTLALDAELLLGLAESAFLGREQRLHARGRDRDRTIARLDAERDQLRSQRDESAEQAMSALEQRLREAEAQRDQLAGALRELQRRRPRRRGLVPRLLSSLAPEHQTQRALRRGSKPRGRRREFAPFEPRVDARPSSPRIATILDEFSQKCLEYEAELVVLDIKRWREQMQNSQPAFLLAESAWRGNQGQWRYLFSKYESRDPNPLRELLTWCKTHGVPSVFWNKEDPPNFEVFRKVATAFDYVFTTDADCIPRYLDLCGHDRVFSLPFAAQPAIHNPASDAAPRHHSVCFAGSWRADKYPERVADSKMLLTAALEFDLDIYDRFHGTPDAERFRFPEPFRSRVRGSLNYDQMLTAYRAYKVFLNVNSVTESPTMFARRVFELMACGTPVVSSESRGIRELLGSHVRVATSAEEAASYLRPLLTEDEFRERYAHAGYRQVLSNHTYAHRLATVFAALGLESPLPPAPTVSIIAATNRPDRLENLVASVSRQVHPNTETIVVLNADNYKESAVREATRHLDNIIILRQPETATLADCLNAGVERASGEYIAKFDDDDYYGAHYLSDLLLPRLYSSASVMGKQSFFAYMSASDQMALRFAGKSHRHTTRVHGATLLIARDVFTEVRFTPVRQGTDTIFLRECGEKGIGIYSSDPYNFVHVRHASLDTHTWKITDDEFLKNCSRIRPGLAMDEVMI